MVRKVLVYVEGQTEETFVKRVLVPHLNPMGIALIPILAKTKRTKAGSQFKGGITSYEKTRREILRLLGDTSAALVTTMIDLYGLPKEFPGRDALPAGTCYERVARLEQEFGADIGLRRFQPYLQLHEFEAVVFVAPPEVARVFPVPDKHAELAAICAQFASPEEIDDGEATAPSKRLRALFPGYQKALHSPLIAQRTGLAAIREQCRHFDEWLIRVEHLAPAADPVYHESTPDPEQPT